MRDLQVRHSDETFRQSTWALSIDYNVGGSERGPGFSQAARRETG